MELEAPENDSQAVYWQRAGKAHMLHGLPDHTRRSAVQGRSGQPATVSLDLLTAKSRLATLWLDLDAGPHEREWLYNLQDCLLFPNIHPHIHIGDLPSAQMQARHFGQCTNKHGRSFAEDSIQRRYQTSQNQLVEFGVLIP